MRFKLFLSLLLSAVLSSTAQTAVVTGSVIDADTGSPVAGAVVTIQDQGISVTTGPAGDFRISNARPGEAVLTIVAPGYEGVPRRRVSTTARASIPALCVCSPISPTMTSSPRTARSFSSTNR